MEPNGFDSAWDERETRTIKKMTEKYAKVKDLFLYAEEIDNKVTFLPASNEFRSAFDHLMRVYAFKFGFKSSENVDYPHENLDKSFGHIYRAGYDVLDYLHVKLTKNILDTMEKYKSSTISDVCPEYYRKIVPDLESFAEEIAIIRSKKDIGDLNEIDFDRYIEIVNKIKSYNMAVIKIENSLAEFESKRGQWGNIKILYGSITTLIILGLKNVITYLFVDKSTSFALEFSSTIDTSTPMAFLLILFIAFTICYIYCGKGN